jgi:tRNA pseudouridine(55) synthase
LQKRVYEKGEINKLFVVNKPMFISSNFYLNRFKRAYKNKKAGFSGTLDPFAKGCLIVAFGQYAKLFKYLEKTPKVYKAVIWLGVTSESLDIERIQDIVIKEKLETDFIKKEIEKLKGEIEYIPPKFSAKRVNGQKAYEIARKNEKDELEFVYVIESKGEQLAGNEDTEYKDAVLNRMTAMKGSIEQVKVKTTTVKLNENFEFELVPQGDEERRIRTKIG